MMKTSNVVGAEGRRVPTRILKYLSPEAFAFAVIMTILPRMDLKLDTPVQFIKGVGPKLGDVLRKKGVATVQDLLEWYPRAYEDRRAARNIASLKPKELVRLRARVVRVSSFNMGASRRKMYDVTVTDGTGKIHCKFF